MKITSEQMVAMLQTTADVAESHRNRSVELVASGQDQEAALELLSS